MGIKMSLLNKQQTIQLIKDWVSGSQQKIIVTVNPEFLVLAKNNQNFLNILQTADLATCDGFGLKLAGLLMSGINLPRVTGVDLSLELLQQRDYKLFLLGSTNEVLEKMNKKFVQHNIVGYCSGGLMNENYQLSQQDKIIEQIKNSGANLLLVAFGQIKQEIWIKNNLHLLPNIKVAIGVGGTFDFLSGKIPRAPKLMRQIGLEWLYRLIQEPSRILRIWRATVVFVLIIIKEKIKGFKK